ncbi:hypothetical protein JM47_02175 [Ureaplasma diversum]|uniref:Uncharacterized protein n=2 Tax=Ureaplasma diversum TaxID=42094 RepID=A0A084EXZ0_9BACT|nr:hypothetical protein [Ureaplasma diversum]AJQ45386.1 hypothetical protein JM47_02175 [Ureaplasma diversum]KEZ22832.1 hypothetical protein UDIV_4700 [Ureaplasma diversum NCTC 246]
MDDNKKTNNINKRLSNTTYVANFFSDSVNEKWFKKLQRKWFFTYLWPFNNKYRRGLIIDEIKRELIIYLSSVNSSDYFDPFHFEILFKKYFSHKPLRWFFVVLSGLIGSSVSIALLIVLLTRIK